VPRRRRRKGPNGKDGTEDPDEKDPNEKDPDKGNGRDPFPPSGAVPPAAVPVVTAPVAVSPAADASSSTLPVPIADAGGALPVGSVLPSFRRRPGSAIVFPVGALPPPVAPVPSASPATSTTSPEKLVDSTDGGAVGRPDPVAVEGAPAVTSDDGAVEIETEPAAGDDAARLAAETGAEAEVETGAPVASTGASAADDDGRSFDEPAEPRLGLPFAVRGRRPPWWAVAIVAVVTGAVAGVISAPLVGLAAGVAVAIALVVPQARAVTSIVAVGLLVAAGVFVVHGQAQHAVAESSDWASAYESAGVLVWMAVVFLGADAVVETARQKVRRRRPRREPD
jgi:hypothetical protein